MISWAACNRTSNHRQKVVKCTMLVQIFTLIKDIYIYMYLHKYMYIHTVLESYMEPPNIIYIHTLCAAPNIFHHTYTYTRKAIYHPSFSDFCSSQLILQFGPSNSPCFQHQAPTTHLVTRWTQGTYLFKLKQADPSNESLILNFFWFNVFDPSPPKK